MTQHVTCSLLLGIAVNGMSATVHAQATNPPAAAAEAKPATASQPPPKAPSVPGGGIIDAARQFNINGQRVLSFDANSNLFVGGNAGANTTGGFNAFVGADAGIGNITGQANSYFGARAGQAVQMGNANAAFGFEAGMGGPGPQSTASENSFFGWHRTTAATDRCVERDRLHIGWKRQRLSRGVMEGTKDGVRHPGRRRL